jgi:hypothetical protein
MSIPKLAVLSVALVTYAALRISSIWKQRRRVVMEAEVPVICQARKEIGLGVLFAAIGTLPLLSITAWLWACVGGAGGLLLGLRAGRAQALVFQGDLERHGAIAPLVHSAVWIPIAFLVAAVMAVAAYATAPSVAFWIHRRAITGIGGAVFMWPGAFLCAHGVYIWLWAKRKERQGYGRLIITSRTEWPLRKG